MAPIVIGDDTIQVEFEPAIGASWLALRVKWNGRWISLTRPSPSPLTRSIEAASYSMFPYSNRIRDGRFEFDGASYQLRDADKHALHGDVRERPWVVEDVRPESLRRFACSFTIDSRNFADINFPFPFSVSLAYIAGVGVVRMMGRIRNEGTLTMPVGGGFHPYFARDPAGVDDDLRIRFSAPHVYEMEADSPLPVALASAEDHGLDFRKSRFVPFGLDHCFGGWDGLAILYWPRTGLSMRIIARPTDWFDHLVIYSPHGKSFVAVEPAANANDAVNFSRRVNTPYPAKTLSPGGQIEFDVEYHVYGIWKQ